MIILSHNIGLTLILPLCGPFLQRESSSCKQGYECPLLDGIRLFVCEGAYYYWVTKSLLYVNALS